MRRRERTRQLIELGGLIAKAEIIDLVKDDRAVIFGMLLEAAGKLRSEDGEQQRILWSRRGSRAFNPPADALDTSALEEHDGGHRLRWKPG